MGVRLGEILVIQGLLTKGELSELLELQQERSRPIGLLAEELFGIKPSQIEDAWAQQYALGAEHVDPLAERVQARALSVIDRRQAWQFTILPLRFDDLDLVAATTEENLVRALRFVSRCLARPCYLVLSEADALGEALGYYYPMAGLSGATLSGQAPIRHHPLSD